MNLKYDISKLTDLSCEVTIILENDDTVALYQRNQEVNEETVTRTPHYDVYRGYSGYQQDTILNYGDESEIKCYLIKDEQGTIRSVVSYEYSSGNYTVSAPSYVTDAYGAWMDPDAFPANNTHYVRYISGLPAVQIFHGLQNNKPSLAI